MAPKSIMVKRGSRLWSSYSSICFQSERYDIARLTRELLIWLSTSVLLMLHCSK
jgi:hypothetical protein